MNAMVQNDVTETLRSLKRANRRNRLVAAGLIAPLAFFLLFIFMVPVVMLLKRAVENPEVVNALPQTSAALGRWSGKGDPPDEAFAALVRDLEADKGDKIGVAAGRLNRGKSGFRSLLLKSVEAMPLTKTGEQIGPSEYRQRLTAVDARWSDVEYWQEIAKNSARYTPFYLLAALDLTTDETGKIVSVEDGASNYRDLFGRTFMISAIVTLAALLIGYPLAYWISQMSPRKANLVMIFVLLPFWTSILVRISAWIVLLQNQGLINKSLMALNIVDKPLDLLFNRAGVLISMTHILLPFMVLPLYSVMHAVPPTYQRAAISLGSNPFSAFWKVYVPQTLPGIGAGSLLVFILALGYYITPALLGGPGDQMISYYVAYFTNVSVNWGLACALGALLLAATLVLFAISRRIALVKQKASSF